MMEFSCLYPAPIHTGPWWIDKNTGQKICSRHKAIYDAEETLPSFRRFVIIPVCIGCGSYDSLKWWHCCEDHCPSDEPGVVCDGCRARLHAPTPPPHNIKGVGIV